MFVVHLRRVQRPMPDARGWERLCDRALDGMMWAEPYIAASFLLVVGFSLALSRARASNGRRWLRHLAGRAGTLYLLAVLLFLVQFGPVFPEAFVSPGILSAIALAILVVGLSLTAPRPLSALAGTTILVLGITAALDAWNHPVVGLTAGPGGAFPIVAFSAIGALVGSWFWQRGPRVLVWTAGICAIPFGAALVREAPWISWHPSQFPEYGSEVALWGLLGAEPSRTVATHFWNHTVWGWLGLLLPLSLSLGSLIGAQDRLASTWPAWPALVVGRHALAAYVGHLGVLGCLEIAGLGPSGPVATWMYATALFLLAAVCGALWERGHEPVAHLRAWTRRPPFG